VRSKATGAALDFAKLDRLTTQRGPSALVGGQRRGPRVLRSATCAAWRNGPLPADADGVRGQAGGRADQRAHQGRAAAKARGLQLGNPNGARALRGKQIGNHAAVTRIKAGTRERADNLRAIVEDIRHQGETSVRAMADALNDRAILTPRGGRWHPTSVARLLGRLSSREQAIAPD
jgi:hypothetical protein